MNVKGLQKLLCLEVHESQVLRYRRSSKTLPPLSRHSRNEQFCFHRLNPQGLLCLCIVGNIQFSFTLGTVFYYLTRKLTDYVYVGNFILVLLTGI